MAAKKEGLPVQVLHFYYRNKTAIWAATAAAAVAYGAYSCSSSSAPSTSGTHSQQPPKARSRLQQLRSTFGNYATLLSALSDSAALVGTDLNTFLSSDCNEVPQSLKQLAKLLQSSEVQDTVKSVAASCMTGAMQAASASAGSGTSTSRPLLDTLLEAVLSDRGQGLVGMAVGMASRNATDSFCQFLERQQQSLTASTPSQGFGLQQVMELLTSDRGERFLSLLITKSIKTAISTYVDVTAGYNMYEDLLTSLSKDEHRAAVTDIMSRVTAAFCKEVALAYRKSRLPLNSHSTASAHAASVHAEGPLQPGMVLIGEKELSKQSSVSLSFHAPGGAAATGADASSKGTIPSSNSQQQVAALPLSVPLANSGRGQSGSANSLVRHNVHQQRVSYSGCASSAITAMVGTSPDWVKQVAALARERDVRTLAVDVVHHASRAAVRGAVEGFMQPSTSASSRGSGMVRLSGLSSQLTTYRLYVLACLAISLFMYSMSPRTLLL